MHRASLFACLFPIAVVVPHADAASAYRCTGADGVLSFQDQPCRSGQIQRVVALPDDAATPAPPAVAPKQDGAEPPPASSAPPVRSLPPRVPPPTFFLCTHFDGSRYLSETGIGSSSWVPFGADGEMQGSLAEAYGGRNGIGVSAPGLRTPPNIASPIGGIAYTRVDDECHHAGPQEACAYLRTELDNVEDRLKRAFSDTEAQLQQEQVTLRERMRGC